MSVAPGEVIALLGRNGSGKTTLLRVISTALRPTRGTGKVFGYDLLQEADRIREIVGVLGHAPGLYGDLTAEENLRFAMRMSGHAPDPVMIGEALEAVGLADEADERVRGFSAGMQRRLSLARLMIRRPRLALLDEPYASFDTDGIERVNAFLADLKAAGHAVIVATHDLPKASVVADRVVEIRAGQLLESDGRVAGVGGDVTRDGRVGERVEA